MVNEPEKTTMEDALTLVHLRNAFYKSKFRWLLIIYILSLIMIAFLGGVLYYEAKNPVHPLYFVTDPVGRLIQDLPRKQPNMSVDDAGAWAAKAVESAYTYNFVNYRAQLQDVQKYFTEFGWRNFLAGLTASNNLIALTEKKYVIVAKAVAKPKLLVQGVLGSGYGWKFEIPLLVTYMYPPFDGKSQFQNPIIVTVVIQRQSILTSYGGLGVMQMIGNLAIGTPTPNMGTVVPPS